MEASKAGDIERQPLSKIESAFWPGAKLRNTKKARQIWGMSACVGVQRVLLVGQDHTVGNREKWKVMAMSNDQ